MPQTEFYTESCRINNKNQNEATESVIQDDLVGNGIVSLISAKTELSGTCSDWISWLKEEIGEQARSKFFPSTPKGMSSKIKRLTPALKRVGIEVTTKRKNSGSYYTISQNVTEDDCIEI